MLGEVLCYGVLSGKPLCALARSCCVLHDAGYQGLSKAENQCAAVLKDVTAVWCDAVGYSYGLSGLSGR
jgi:hypothetical protein